MVMKKRKPETCLAGQAKISKFFCQPVVVLKGNSSLSDVEISAKKSIKSSYVITKNADKSKQAESSVANVTVQNSPEYQKLEKSSKDIILSSTDTNLIPREILADIHHLSNLKYEANNKIDASDQFRISSVCSNHISREARSPSDTKKYCSSSDEERVTKHSDENKSRSTSPEKAIDPQSKLSELTQVKDIAIKEIQCIFRQETNDGLCAEKYQALGRPDISLLCKSSDDLIGKVPTTNANPKHEQKSITKKCTDNEAGQCKSSLSELQDKDAAVETFEDMSFDEWDFHQCDLDTVDDDYNLQLDSAKRCKVIRSIDGPGINEKTLVVSSTENNEVAKCVIRGIWATSCRAVPGDVVRLKCIKYDKIEKCWILDDDTSDYSNTTEPIGSPINQLGHLIEFPDMLISGTSVVGSLFCPRKSVLSDRFRGFESCSPPPLLLNNPTMMSSASDSRDCDVQPIAQNSARIMLIGSLVHELLQKSLSGNLSKQFDLGKVCHEILHDKITAEAMYAAQVNLCDIRKEVMDFIPKISHFMRRFVESCDQSNSSSSCGKWGRGENVDEAREWNGKICEVKDIEENLWVPSLGLKGKVDVTVMVKIHPKSQRGTKDYAKEMPLELKTGRNTYSPEHQGQVLLYCMMMSALAATKDTPSHAINSGLLLYLREESMREVVLGKHTERDLIILRNSLAYYLGRGPGVVEDGCSTINESPTSSALKLPQLSLPDLPEPINHRKACSNCPYLTICAAHLNCDKSSECISKNHPMSMLVPQALKHLKPEHLDFFVHWSCLVSLENQECQKEMNDYFIWTKKPQEREVSGKSICHLVVVEVKFVSSKGSKSGSELTAEGYLHHMARNNEFQKKTFSPAKESSSSSCLPSSTFNKGERVLISSNNRVAISSGTVVSLTEDILCVCCDRDLTVRYGNGDFHVDKYDCASSSSSFCLTSLGLLLEDNWSAARLRELVIEKRKPKYLKKLDGKVILKCSSVLKGLDKPQVRAVLRSLSADDYLLVRGLPGTGKTTTIVKMVQAFILMGRSVLLTGHTRSSVDSVMLKLVKLGLGDSLIRLGGSLSKMDSELWQYSESTLTMDARSPQDLERIYQSKAIVGTTCMGCGHPLLSNRAFDVCILDEAGQVLLPISLRPILSCKVFVLVGDPDQLPPVVRGHRARQMGLDQTLFNVLDSQEACVTLDVQHRMNSVITKLANDLSYGSQLICANDHVANSTAIIPKLKELMDVYVNERWLSTAISPEINYSAVFIDTGNTLHLIDKEFYPNESKKMNISYNSGLDNAHKYSNICEAAIVFYIVKALLRGGVSGGSIGVITPYSEQVSLLKSVLSNIGSGIAENDGKVMLDVNTVDQFQGKDKEIIIYSFTRSGNVNVNDSKPKEHELMSNKSRLTVAVTRAKHKLICIGDMEKLKTYDILKEFMSHIPENNLISLSNDECGFNWSKVFHSIKNNS